MFIFSPVLESGVAIHEHTKKIYGVLNSQRNSQRAFFQIIARCRKVEDPVINVVSDRFIQVNTNQYFLDIQRCIRNQSTNYA